MRYLEDHHFYDGLIHSGYVVTIAIRIYVSGFPTVLVVHGEYLCLSLHNIGNEVI